MNPIQIALRRPWTVVVGALAILLAGVLAVGGTVFEQLGLPYPAALPKGMEVDVFPSLNLPVIYVCQPYGGMDPAQMEGFLTNYYEYHFLYISGIHHVESRNVQGTALMKLYFHPGTNMAQAMAETINYVNRSQAFMPPGTVSPFVMRFDTGSVPVGCLVLSSATRTIAEIQDLALFRVRPMFASLPGVSAPPPFGGSARTIVITVDPQRLKAYGMSPEEVVSALASGNVISPSGNLLVDDKYPIVSVNSVVKDPQQLQTVPIRLGPSPVYLRDVGTVADSADAPAGYALANGRRAVYILATKRADASTMSVIANIKRALPEMRALLPPDIAVNFEFDQSPYVARSATGVAVEGALGAALVGLMVFLFLRDWRSALVVALNIPLALCCSLVALWICGETLNVMTLGGLALAVGILVDEAAVEVENIHAQMLRTDSVALAVRLGNQRTAVPRLLAMLCILAVFIPTFFMQGAARGLFAPLALAVGFAMVGSYVLSSTLVPVLCVWFLRRSAAGVASEQASWFSRFRVRYQQVVGWVVAVRWLTVAIYLTACIAVIVWCAPQLGREIFPVVDSGQFRLRLRAPDGTQIARTEQYALDVLKLVRQEVGAENVNFTLGYVGMIHSNFPVNAVYQWSRGPEEAILYVQLREPSEMNVAQLEERLRKRIGEAMPELRTSFEPSDIVNEVMSFGSPTPLEIAISGTTLADSRSFAEKIRGELTTIPSLRDIQFGQSMDYPTIEIRVDREKAGLSNVTPLDVARTVSLATSSSRFTMPNFWADPKTGIGYQVQVEVPRAVLRSPDERVETIKTPEDLAQLPVSRADANPVLVRDVARIEPGTMPGQFDRYNMRRQVTVTANIFDQDLGAVASLVEAAIARAGTPPAGTKVELRGQLVPFRDLMHGLTVGSVMTVVVIFLLLTASFQSPRLAIAAVSSVPAVAAGSLLALYLTHSTLNLQSFIGVIMALGVAMANAIVLITFSESLRRDGQTSGEAAIAGGAGRLRAVMMTSSAMVAGMLPMALALGQSGQQNAPLGRAVIGGLLAATVATLFALPAVFAVLQSKSRRESGSLDPTDPQANQFRPEAAGLLGEGV
ncbi:MAG TPA: efflux RND transporter permease subunit [Pirellulales bacterium]|nr:efflux RND transporter permease subunit [Pirellulales bacterium]